MEKAAVGWAMEAKERVVMVVMVAMGLGAPEVGGGEEAGLAEAGGTGEVMAVMEGSEVELVGAEAELGVVLA